MVSREWLERAPRALLTTIPAPSEGKDGEPPIKFRLFTTRLPAASHVASELPHWLATVFVHVTSPFSVELAVSGPAGGHSQLQSDVLDG